jgi:RHS repeat-associated protein
VKRSKRIASRSDEQRALLVDDVLSTDRVHADGTSFATDPIFRYQYTNHLHSACLELDDSADIISYEEYHTYGTSAYRATATGLEAPTKRYRYKRMERDEESSLGYHNARYYCTPLMRWTSSDPVGLGDE